MEVFPLSEGRFTVDQTKKFIPFNDAADILTERSRGSLLVEIQPFLVKAGDEILLLDTGLGFSEAENEMQIHENLKAAGVLPGDVTGVLMSHLHKDHAGGMLDRNNNPAFPNAFYYVNEQEWNMAISGESASYIPEEFIGLKNSSQLKLLPNRGKIGEFIHFEQSGGHSEFHQVFRIQKNNEIIFFGGDEAPQLQQMKHRFKAKYDSNGQRAMELREQWWREGQDEKWTFLFYHDIKNPTYRVS